jgi:hypothetical protein
MKHTSAEVYTRLQIRGVGYVIWCTVLVTWTLSSTSYLKSVMLEIDGVWYVWKL